MFWDVAVNQLDGSVVLAGDYNDDFYVTKLDAQGTLEWSFQVKPQRRVELSYSPHLSGKLVQVDRQ